MTTLADAHYGAGTADHGDLPVHLATVTVLMRCPQPLNQLEVAVVLETCGYNAGRITTTGAASLMELAAEVYALVPVYAGAALGSHQDDNRVAGLLTPAADAPSDLRRSARSFCRGLAFTAPLLVNLVTMLVAGVSLWSSRVELAPVAGSMTLATCLALVSTGPFIHAFGRRASLYLGLGDEGMLAYLTRRVLGTGMLAALVTCGCAYLVQVSWGTSSPVAADRLGMAAGLAIAALQIGLAPFYLRDELWPMIAIVGAAAAALVWHVTHLGSFIDPINLAVWQVHLVAAMAALTWLADAWWLLRIGRARRKDHGGGRPITPVRPDRRVWLPSGHAVARAVAPYASYGLAYFILVCMPQLVSGGAWLGRYQFDGPYSLASGVALVGMVPVAGVAMVAADRLVQRLLPRALTHLRISEVDQLRSVIAKQWRSQLALAAIAGLVAMAVLDIVVPDVAHGWLVAHGMAAAPSLLYVCSAGFFLFSLGTFASQLLFGMASPGRPVLAAIAGAVTMLVSTAVLSYGHLVSLPMGAALGFLAGSAVFAALGMAAGQHAFSHVDFTCYRAL